VYARIQRSRTHGVGLFAVRNIKKGTELFGGDDSGMVWVEKKEIARLPKEVKRLYTHLGVLKDGRYGCPLSFNQLTPAWYLNDSKTAPNVRCDANYDFFALRDIKAGEELTLDYSTYSENA
jgi:SET domain-containing protein